MNCPSKQASNQPIRPINQPTYLPTNQATNQPTLAFAHIGDNPNPTLTPTLTLTLTLTLTHLLPLSLPLVDVGDKRKFVRVPLLLLQLLLFLDFSQFLAPALGIGIEFLAGGVSV